MSDEDATRILARISRGCYAENGPVEFKLNCVCCFTRYYFHRSMSVCRRSVLCLLANEGCLLTIFSASVIQSNLQLSSISPGCFFNSVYLTRYTVPVLQLALIVPVCRPIGYARSVTVSGVPACG